MKKAPAMPLFGDAYMADTRHLSLEEHGAYLSLLMIAWRSEGCRLPNDDKRLSQMLGITGKRWAKIKPAVMAFWTLTDDGWEQKRLLKERQFVSKKSEQNAEAANVRWNAKQLENNDNGDANASAMQCERNAPPPPLSKEEEQVGGKPPIYAFFGKTIRLKPSDFQKWKRLFHTILDIEAELTVIDGWWQEQPDAKRKGWYFATERMLNKRHQSNLATQREAEDDPDAFYMP